jgi:glycine/D-amino acid oxidase-like deaminating enzyme
MSATLQHSEYDAIVIGGGFYGCSLATALTQQLHRVLLLERESDLLTRASFANQARVHNGYHYPRSLLTAKSSAVNYPRFMRDFPDCIDNSFTHAYAIVRGTSKVTAYQFRKFCEQVGIPLRRPTAAMQKMFNGAMIEEIFVAEECAFDAVKLRTRMTAKLQEAGVETACNTEVDRIRANAAGDLSVVLRDGTELGARYVFNCTYSGINHLLARSGLDPLPLKHEVTELALIEMPPALRQVGVTVMDGPFFSSLPFPSAGLHTLSHVSYTPHESWNDLGAAAPRTANLQRSSKSMYMMKDCQRYMPALRDARYVRSLFETKTVLLRNEVDDGRPILCYRDHGFKGLFVILGAKIDNIYDIVQIISAEQFQGRTMHAQCS